MHVIKGEKIEIDKKWKKNTEIRYLQAVIDLVAQESEEYDLPRHVSGSVC